MLHSSKVRRIICKGHEDTLEDGGLMAVFILKTSNSILQICAAYNMSSVPECRSLCVLLRGTEESIAKCPYSTVFNTFYILGLCSVGDQIQDILHIKHVKHLKIPVKYTPSFPNVTLPVLYSKTGQKLFVGDTVRHQQ